MSFNLIPLLFIIIGVILACVSGFMFYKKQTGIAIESARWAGIFICSAIVIWFKFVRYMTQ
ncbi:MAG: hypothetical protein IK065_03465 [Neisseriaceae bacterium]|nr:hypothetical protein [Neisseriaceae bacterium]